MSITVIVPAAGMGTRFGGEIPKQFIQLSGKPILLHTVERFLLDEEVTKIIVAVAEPLLASVKQTPGDRVQFVAGGATRQESVLRALAVTDEADVIAVHDSVRPFFRISTFQPIVTLAREHGAALPALPVTDTMHVVADDFTIASTLDRRTLAAAQTPQCFRAEVLRDVLERAVRDNLDVTDEATLAARFGYTVKVVPGDVTNIKITRPEDLAIAESWLKETAES